MAKLKKKKMHLILFFLCFFLFLRFAFVGTAQVRGTSMSPTLSMGDRILYFKHVEATRGDIVFIQLGDGHDLFVKRIVGIEGDHVRTWDRKIYINDIKIATLFSEVIQDFVVPDGHIYLLGDNVDYSEDSRSWGAVDEKKIKGIAYLKINSLKEIQRVNITSPFTQGSGK